MQETLSLCLGKQQETLSTYPEQIRNWNELRSVKVKLRYEVKCGGVATYAPASQTINHWKCQRCLSGAPNENIVQNHLNVALLNVF